MGSVANIATLTNSVLNSLLPQFNFNETYTAGISFGGGDSSSMYYNNYGDFCTWLDAAQASVTVVGLLPADLINVFETYDAQLLRSGRNYKKVLVVLTAVSNETQIQAALSYANNLMSDGVYIIVGALGVSAPSSSLYQLGNYAFNSTDFTVPSNVVIDNVCQFGGNTIFPPTEAPGSTITPTDPRSDAIGAACSTKTKMAWLDIVFVIDISNAMGKEELHQLAFQLAGFITKFNISQTGDHTTRASIITYATSATVRYGLQNVTTLSGVIQAILKLDTYFDPTDSGIDARDALDAAGTHLKDQKSHRIPVVIFTASAYNKHGFDGADNAAKRLKADGVSIFSIDYDKTGYIALLLQDISTQGYYYKADQSDISKTLPFALTQVNCYCPDDTLQFRTFNRSSMTYTSYANCISGTDITSMPIIITSANCDINNNSVLAAVTSPEKLDFITDRIMPNPTQLNKSKEFIVGGHLSDNGDGQWMWYDFDKSSYPFGNFPSIYVKSPEDTNSFFQKGFGFHMDLTSMASDDSKPYICESKACDAENFCVRKN
uniref:VWFA domain-containing protein n=1 Tax=Panagrolaimus sp. PS1159 TaxID=55785 RepID=A0AC35G904_9BILA